MELVVGATPMVQSLSRINVVKISIYKTLLFWLLCWFIIFFKLEFY